MNDDITDRDLSRAWRAASRERPPAELDRSILDQAHDAASARSRRTRRVQPFAFAATLVLGVALLLDMQSVEQTLPAPAAREERQAEPDDATGATDGESSSAAGTAGDATRPAAPEPEQAPTVQDDSGTLREFRRLGASALERLDDSRERAEAEAPAAAKSLARPAAERELSSLVDDPACDGEFRASPQTWARCIRALESAGEAELATSERDALATRHPEFTLPD